MTLFPSDPRQSSGQHTRSQSSPAVEGAWRDSSQLLRGPIKAVREIQDDSRSPSIPIEDGPKKWSSQVISVNLSTAGATQPELPQPDNGNFFLRWIAESICPICWQPYIAHRRVHDLIPPSPGAEVPLLPVVPVPSPSVFPGSSSPVIRDSMQTSLATSVANTPNILRTLSVKHFWVLLILLLLALIQGLFMFGLEMLNQWARRK
jgi:hypothetical protein